MTVKLLAIIIFVSIETYLHSKAKYMLEKDPNNSPYIPIWTKVIVYHEFGRIAKDRQYSELSDTEQQILVTTTMMNLQKNGLPSNEEKVMAAIRLNEACWNCIIHSKKKC